MSLHPMENLDYRVKLPAVHPACCSPVAAPTGVGAPRGVKPRGAPPHPMSCCCKPIAVLADGSENELIIPEAAHPPAPADPAPAEADHPPAPAPADHPPAPAPAQSQQSGSSESHPRVQPLLLGDRIRARAAKQRLLKKMTFSDRFSPLE